MAAITIWSDFGAPKNKVCHCFPTYFPWSDGTRCHDLSFLNVELLSMGFSRQEHWSGFPFPSPVHESEKWKWSRSVMSDSLRPHELQHARHPCPSSNPGVYSNSCPLSWWYHLAISSSVVPFSSCPQSLPASESFPMSQLFAWVAKVLEFQLQH